jgi:PhnB protein
MACRDMFYGDRVGALEDPFGYVWTVAAHVEDVPPQEYEKRMEAWASTVPGGSRK